MTTKRYHIALDVSVDRHNDRYLLKHYNGVLRHEGRLVQVPDDLRRLCAEYRAKGFEVFPPCDHVDARGLCLGHEVESEEGTSVP